MDLTMEAPKPIPFNELNSKNVADVTVVVKYTRSTYTEGNNHSRNNLGDIKSIINGTLLPQAAPNLGVDGVDHNLNNEFILVGGTRISNRGASESHQGGFDTIELGCLENAADLKLINQTGIAGGTINIPVGSTVFPWTDNDGVENFAVCGGRKGPQPKKYRRTNPKTYTTIPLGPSLVAAKHFGATHHSAGGVASNDANEPVALRYGGYRKDSNAMRRNSGQRCGTHSLVALNLSTGHLEESSIDSYSDGSGTEIVAPTSSLGGTLFGCKTSLLYTIGSSVTPGDSTGATRDLLMVHQRTTMSFEDEMAFGDDSSYTTTIYDLGELYYGKNKDSEIKVFLITFRRNWL